MRILDIFKEITAIPHCSGATQALRDYIVDFAKKSGFMTEVDDAGNILCYKSNRHICLQSHYDMVCVGRAPDIDLVEREGWLCAKDASLGADNGIGVAMMLALMEEGKEAEYLFTNDEEIGLVGAKKLQLRLQAKKMINLDSEEFGAVYVGCAGGVDMHAAKEVALCQAEGFFYEIISRNFPGGHSGVDIHKNIPNAVKEFAHFAKGCKVAALEAGERLNSIPVHLRAVVASPRELASSEHFIVTPTSSRPVIDYDIIGTLCAAGDGVLGLDESFGIPSRSCNLAKVAIHAGKIAVDVSLRANSDAELARLKEELDCFWSRDFALEWSGEYPAWEPRISDLARQIASLYERYVPRVSFKAIHAGLECAIFAHDVPEIASIGPDIRSPHSVHECVRIETIEPIYEILRELL